MGFGGITQELQTQKCNKKKIRRKHRRMDVSADPKID